MGALVAQWIEQISSKDLMGVRFPPGARAPIVNFERDHYNQRHCQGSSVVEQGFHKAKVVGPNPTPDT